jgi:type I restriction enzyme S subunit
VLSSIGARCGKCFFATPPWTTLANTQAILPAAELCDPRFLFQYVNDEGYWHRSGSAQPFIAPSTVKKAWVALPPLAEQRKIAAILSSVDETIEKTEAVIARSSAVREAVMAEKLSRGDWDRRMGVAADNGWDEVLLDSVAHRASGHTPDKKRADYWNGGIKWLSLRDSYRLDRVYVGDTDSTISELGIENSSAVLHKAGVVVLSRDAGVGKSAISTVDMAVSQHFLCWRCGPSLDAHFLYYWLQWMKPVFEKIAAGNTIKTIGLPFFKSLKIPLPPLSYQREVASVLKSIDDYRRAGEASVLQLSNTKAVLASELLSGNLRVSPAESVA